MSDLPEHTLDALTKGPEGFTTTEHGTVFIDGPDAVHLFRLGVIRSSLRFEINTGMKMTRVSALKAANAALGTKYRRKQQALDHLDSLLTTFDDDE
jgi:hypothetical protein